MNAGRKHVVLIDDDPDMHDAVRLILEARGYRVTCHATGPAGLEAIREEPPDLVLLDIMLSSPTEGYELAAALRTDGALRQIPLIMVSSLDPQAGAEFAREAGAAHVVPDGFLVKPLDARALLEAVNQVLSAAGA